jgi:hypothetical protein
MTEQSEATVHHPLLCLDVNLGNGLAPQIIINEGDDVDRVADEFAVMYRLPEYKKKRLVDAIKAEIVKITDY